MSNENNRIRDDRSAGTSGGDAAMEFPQREEPPHSPTSPPSTRWSPTTARASDLHSQLSHQLKETAPVIRSALERLHGRPVLIVSLENVPVTNGRIVLLEGTDGSALPSLTVEFMLRGLVFAMEVPLGRVFDLVGSWTGTHFVFRLPGVRFRIDRAPG